MAIPITPRSSCRAASLLAATALAACDAPSAAVELTAMQYNIAGIRDGQRGQAIVDAIAAARPDLLSLQECAGCEVLLAALPGYAVAPIGTDDVALGYDATRWDLREGGAFTLGGDDDGWGTRVTRWAHLVPRDGGGNGVYLYGTHWCVPIRSADDACDDRAHVGYAEATLARVAARRHPDAPAVLAGDLNVFDGEADGPALRALRDGGLVDAVRTRDPRGDATSFHGNAWAPPAALDYILTTRDVEVLDAGVERTLTPGAGSDHDPVIARLRVPG
ncbi:MAG: endonuclease/exonuclease/phosphatase family protein [Kofleriaceae bacterium]